MTTGMKIAALRRQAGQDWKQSKSCIYHVRLPWEQIKATESVGVHEVSVGIELTDNFGRVTRYPF